MPSQPTQPSAACSYRRRVEELMTPDAQSRALAIGDVVQIDPDSGPVYGGCLLTIDELLGWGVSGFVTVPSAEGAKLHQYRAESKDIVRVGAAVFRGV